MSTPIAERAVTDCRKVGKALLKFLSTNDVPRPQSHQFGPYLPKQAWQFFTPHAPTKGVNLKSWPEILWPDGRTTKSCITWYGKAKTEYRLTRFGRDFPFLTTDQIGSLLVLIPESHERFIAYVFDREDEIEELFVGLGVEVVEDWGCIFDVEYPAPIESAENCLARQFREYANNLIAFPGTTDISLAAANAVKHCNATFRSLSVDEQLMTLVQAEYQLFQLVERVFCENEVQRLFKSVDDFLGTALSILNRRKVRAVRALENHFEYLMTVAGLNVEVRPKIDGQPDVIVPSREAYDDPAFPSEKLAAIGLKTTCKDRWRQILNEAQRANRRFLVTLQQGISTKQLDEMEAANVTIVVPKPLHRFYAKDDRSRLTTIKSLFDFLRKQQH
ncbi:MAG: type II restriction endonuclease [Planctomycetota bacterium]|nr:type II restriction endonuclease [Planctomycetota bacterium]